MNDGVGGGGCIGEEMRTGGTRGGRRSLVGAAVELNDKKLEIRADHFLRWPLGGTTQQSTCSRREMVGEQWRGDATGGGACWMTPWRRFGR